MLAKEAYHVLTVNFAGPNCVKLDRGVTTWKPMCRLDGCRQPARLTVSNPSKYCSDDHGREFVRLRALRHRESKGKDTSASGNKQKRRKPNLADQQENNAEDGMQDDDGDYDFLRGGVLRASELKALASGVKDVDEFRKLGEGVLSPPPTASPPSGPSAVKVEDKSDPKPHDPKLNYTPEETRQLEEIQQKQKVLKRKRGLLDDKERFLALVRTRAKAVLDDLKQKDRGVKDICGFDARLSWSDEEFDIWRSSSEGAKALESGVLGASSSSLAAADNIADHDGDEKMDDGEIGKGVCLKKRCERHKTWWKLQQQDVAFEKEEVRQEGRKMESEERGVRERAILRLLEGAEVDGEGPQADKVAAEELAAES